MWKSHVSTHLTLLPITAVHIWIYPWGCGLTFASNMLWNFDYVLFSHSTLLTPTTLFPLQMEKVRKIGKNAPHTYEACVHACVFAQWITFHWIQHGFNRFDPFFFLSSGFSVSMSGCACTTFQYIKFCRKSWDVLRCGFESFVLTPPHYPVIKIKCVETKRTMRCNISPRRQQCVWVCQCQLCEESKQRKIDKHVWIPMNTRMWHGK